MKHHFRPHLRPLSTTERVFGWIHLALALLVPLLLVALSGCKEEKQAAPNFGPEVAPAEIEAALTRPMAEVDGSKMKLGEFVHFAETQVINNRTEAEAVLSDTGQTVVDKSELADRIVYTIVQNKIAYSANESRKTSTELELVIKKATSSSYEDPQTASASSTAGAFSLREHAERVIAEENTPLKSLSAVFAAEEAARRVTYHNLKVSLEQVAPPAQVTSQPNCLGIPNCHIRLHKIAFDQIVWTSATQAEKVSFEFSMSPDVPYLATLMNKCATLLVPINADKPSESTKVLLSQCSPVLNFRWEAATAATASELDAPAMN
ncbi:MAG: hypothetical protein NDI61_06755 [Bdellovibrionaceae bacterium]|nr:hypothetical protein [Pseudobdellovibrionaceae bacterium]